MLPKQVATQRYRDTHAGIHATASDSWVHTGQMADKGGRPAVRTGGERIRKLAQAALNADVTVEQVDTILEGLSETLEDLNRSTGNLDATLERFNDTINQINELAPRLHGVVDRMEGIVARVERVVGLGEAVISPLAATDQAVRDAVSRVRRVTGL
jgi:methyl-accepting chemotaxis protein